MEPEEVIAVYDNPSKKVMLLSVAALAAAGGIAWAVTQKNDVSSVDPDTLTPDDCAAGGCPDLKLGSQGERVKMLQTFLSQVGAGSITDTPGIFGSSTEASLKEFQRAPLASADRVEKEGDAYPEDVEFFRKSLRTAATRKSCSIPLPVTGVATTCDRLMLKTAADYVQGIADDLAEVERASEMEGQITPGISYAILKDLQERQDKKDIQQYPFWESVLKYAPWAVGALTVGTVGYYVYKMR